VGCATRLPKPSFYARQYESGDLKSAWGAVAGLAPRLRFPQTALRTDVRLNHLRIRLSTGLMPLLR